MNKKVDVVIPEFPRTFEFLPSAVLYEVHAFPDRYPRSGQLQRFHLSVFRYCTGRLRKDKNCRPGVG